MWGMSVQASGISLLPERCNLRSRHTALRFQPREDFKAAESLAVQPVLAVLGEVRDGGRVCGQPRLYETLP